jgi:DNA-binding NarL/FixJ family response regulator
MKLGAADFMEKPLNKTAFINKVKGILSGSEFDSPAAALKLTKTEKKVLKLILGGCSNKEMALKMRCALRTVEFHRSHIFHKFGVNNAVELTKKAMPMFP